jgi:NAD(P)-dependent dehydrogenase (short-subunit alcohol dehydrogenase family)
MSAKTARSQSKDDRPVALITGASGGLGHFVVKAFRAGGYRVSATGLEWGASQGRDVELRTEADLSQPHAALQIVRQTEKEVGPIHSVLHLVGAFDGGTLVEETADEVWDEMLSTNLKSAANIMRAVIPGMRKRRSGRIVVVGSTAALHPVRTWSAFSASVAALGALVQVAAAELRGTGVTVNAVLPTTIDTPAVRTMISAAEADRSIPPDSLASLMLWLCSEAGASMSGARLPVVAGQPHPCHEFHQI